MAQSTDSPLRKYFVTFKAMKERERKLKLETAIDEKETVSLNYLHLLIQTPNLLFSFLVRKRRRREIRTAEKETAD